MHYFSTFFFGKELYMFRTDLLSIIRSLHTVFTAIGISHTIQLLFQQNAHVFYYQNHKILQSVILSCIFSPTCFNPRGSSSGGSMQVPG
jgi:hypothetical protein